MRSALPEYLPLQFTQALMDIPERLPPERCRLVMRGLLPLGSAGALNRLQPPESA
ncbi:MAG: hypothetical protein K1X42_16880 [Opitutaceae bacterium]|nr:hypothetical protein [Opitutaceae bacterium]